ncbi:MAG: response regulator transcription factor [Bacteroidetes bacterium]|nr:response regulator transcription factor [Bacteroidota bacterium]
MAAPNRMNCIVVDDDEMTCRIVEIMIRKNASLEPCGTFSGAQDALNYLKDHKTDLIFLDVEMPGMSGLEMLEKYNDNLPPVVLITSHKKYAASAFDFDVLDFLVKPILPERFQKAVKKAQKVFEQNKKNPGANPLYVKTTARIVKIDPAEIIFIKSLADYVVIHTLREKFTAHSTMKTILARLPAGQFLRVHHSYIVRLDKISSYENSLLSVAGYKLPVSRSRKKELGTAIKSFLR